MLNADYVGAAKLAAWKKRVKTGWPSVRVEHVESSGVGDAAEVGALLSVRTFVSLGELTPDDVHVQVLHGKIDSNDVLTGVTVQDLDLAESYTAVATASTGHRPRPRRRLRLHRAGDPAQRPAHLGGRAGVVAVA